MGGISHRDNCSRYCAVHKANSAVEVKVPQPALNWPEFCRSDTRNVFGVS